MCLTSCFNKTKDDGATVQPNSIAVNVVDAKIGQTIKDSFNYEYKKLTNEYIVNGKGTMDIWERINPPEKRYWYTPTLTSKVYTNQVPSFNSIFRFEVLEENVLISP